MKTTPLRIAHKNLDAHNKAFKRLSEIHGAVLDLMQGPLQATANEITNAVLSWVHQGAWYDGGTAEIERRVLETKGPKALAQLRAAVYGDVSWKAVARG